MRKGTVTISALAAVAALSFSVTAQAGRPNDPLLGLSIAMQGNQAVEAIQAESLRSLKVKAPALPRAEQVSYEPAGATQVSQVTGTVRCAE